MSSASSSSREKDPAQLSTSPSPTNNDSRSGISTYHDNDVLCGRGQSANIHPGNVYFRSLVEKRLEEFNSQPNTGEGNCSKSKITQSFVDHIRNLDPPGRFLKKNSMSSLYDDIGDDAAKEKAREVLKHLRRQERLRKIKDELSVNIEKKPEFFIQEKNLFTHNFSDLKSFSKLMTNSSRNRENPSHTPCSSNFIDFDARAIATQQLHMSIANEKKKLLQSILDRQQIQSGNIRPNCMSTMDPIEELVSNNMVPLSSLSMNRFGSHVSYGAGPPNPRFCQNNSAQSASSFLSTNIELARINQVQNLLNAVTNPTSHRPQSDVLNDFRTEMLKSQLRQNSLRLQEDFFERELTHSANTVQTSNNQGNHHLSFTGTGNMYQTGNNNLSSMRNFGPGSDYFQNLSSSCEEISPQMSYSVGNRSLGPTSLSSLMNSSTGIPPDEIFSQHDGGAQKNIFQEHDQKFMQNVSGGKLDFSALERARKVASSFTKASLAKNKPNPGGFSSIKTKRKLSVSPYISTQSEKKKSGKGASSSDFSNSFSSGNIKEKERKTSPTHLKYANNTRTNTLNEIKCESLVDQKEVSNENIDSTEYELTSIEKPHAHDVLCGRGQCTNDHPGNIFFRAVVAKKKEEYNILPDQGADIKKRDIMNYIVQQIRGRKPMGRFLKKNKTTNQWEIICDQAARDKAIQALRDLKKKSRSEAVEALSLLSTILQQGTEVDLC
eukprot:CAMPEP_0194297676 /NCGR_PEP_ID=MMETSP0169-20130528/59500_1 /TAXON_ID=218684 /ORGANISM="Corethron pennatum, Strain L29A3" /LENGTH=718 /DNA_ID=CAMNT_0039047555 /DNA_START=113 /DNA_END=2269 /DNA_ORIENTATION=+